MRSIVLLVLGTLYLSAGAAGRDWIKYPAVVEADTTATIFAVGDAHSDYERLAAALHGAGLVDGPHANPVDVEWRGGKAFLVVTGDMIDKGPRAIDVLRMLIHLQKAAAKAGGRVIVLAGNHEAEFMADPTAPKGREFAAQLKAAAILPADVAACHGDLGEFLCSLPFAARVNDCFFSHAGNTAGRSLDAIKHDIETGFAQSGYSTGQLVGDHSLLEARLNGSGPGREPWIDASGPDERKLLESYTAALGVHRIIEGHVPSEVHFTGGAIRKPGEMFQLDGKLFLIDTGMSRGVDDSMGAVLRITTRDATAICPGGGETTLWDSVHQQASGRAAPCR